MSHRCDAKICRQLTAVPTAGEDCGVRTTQRAIRWASCDKVFATVKEIRQWMGKPAGPTNPPDWLTALRHPDLLRRFAKVGLQPPASHLRGVTRLGFIVGSPIKTALAALEADKLICVAESYLPWHGTKYAGSDTFVGNHAVSYFGLEGDTGHRETTRYDSLADGRRPGIAKGPDVVPFHTATKAMGLLDLDSSPTTRRPLGAGLWAGMVVERAEPIKQPPVPPTCEQQLADALAELAALQAGDDDDAEPTGNAPVVEGVTAPAASAADGPEDVS